MVRGALGKVPGSSPAKEVESLRRRVAEVEATALTHAVAEQRILKLNADLRRIFDDAPIGLCYLDTDLRFVHINKWLAQLNGLSVSSHVGKTIREVLPEVAVGVEQQMRQVIATGQPIIAGMVDAETPAQEGVRRTFEHYYQADIGADGAVAGVSCAVLDVTDRRLAEDQFRDSQKLESLGILAGGIAHDFNNLLTGILGYADVILRRISPASPVRVLAEQIRTAADRASDLCDQMLAFSGKGRFVVRPFDLSEAVEVMGKLLAVAIHKSVVLRYELARDRARTCRDDQGLQRS